MAEQECVFCAIVKGKIPSFKVYEDREYLAVLDIFPNIKGQTLVIRKRHMPSYVFGVEDKEMTRMMKTAKKVAKVLEEKLPVGRVHIAFEGTGVNHFHAKLYPAIGMGKEFSSITASDMTFFQHYPGYVTTMQGPRANDIELETLRKQLTE